MGHFVRRAERAGGMFSSKSLFCNFVRIHENFAYEFACNSNKT